MVRWLSGIHPALTQKAFRPRTPTQTNTMYSSSSTTAYQIYFHFIYPTEFLRFTATCHSNTSMHTCVQQKQRRSLSFSGLIIDAFGELRDQQEQVKEDMEVRFATHSCMHIHLNPDNSHRWFEWSDVCEVMSLPAQDRGESEVVVTVCDTGVYLTDELFSFWIISSESPLVFKMI